MILKELRKSANLTQKELAKKLGYEQTIVSMWEKGTREPNIETLIDLSKIFNCSVDEMLGINLIQEKKEPKQIESVIGFQSQSHKECIELINQLTESQALKLCGYIERMLEDEQNKKEKLNKGEN